MIVFKNYQEIPSCEISCHKSFLGPPVVPFYFSFGGVSATKIDRTKSWYPYLKLSTGGPKW